MKINMTNQEKVVAAVDAAQIGCRSRRLDWSDLTSAVAAADKRLESLGIPQKYRVGCTVHLLPEAVPNSYKYTAYGTSATLTRFTTGWFLANVGRTYARSCSGGGPVATRLFLSDTAKAAAPDYYTL
jgi:hypothetical protein